MRNCSMYPSRSTRYALAVVQHYPSVGNRLLLLFICVCGKFANKTEQRSVIRYLLSEEVEFRLCTSADEASERRACTVIDSRAGETQTLQEGLW